MKCTKDHYVALNKNKKRQRDYTICYKIIFSVARIVEEFMSKIKVAKGHYVKVVRSLGIEKTKEKKKSKIVISKSEINKIKMK